MCSPASYALRVHVERIDRVARRHEQPVAVAAAEADVGGALGQHYEANRFAGRIEHLDAVERRAHAPAAPAAPFGWPCAPTTPSPKCYTR
jgi:hypothetical protein